MYTVIHSLISVIIISFIIISSITHIRFVCFLSNTLLPVSDVPYIQNTNAIENTSNSAIAEKPRYRMWA